VETISLGPSLCDLNRLSDFMKFGTGVVYRSLSNNPDFNNN
jgi:hypothetical protein